MTEIVQRPERVARWTPVTAATAAARRPTSR